MVATLPAELPSAAVLVGYEPPQKQKRLTVAFRAILVIPHVLFLFLLAIVVEIVVVISWFAALITGRIPNGIHTFLARFIRYSTRINAYLFLLTDRYPPFDLATEDYPVSVDISQTRLNRAAVLLRLVLVIPAAIVALLLQEGLQIAALFIWLIVLIAGRMPRSLFEAVAAAIRYSTRLNGYLFLVTPTYPSGLFGDHTGDAPPPFPTPSDAPPPVTTTPEDMPPPGYAGDPNYPSTPAPPLARPRATRLVLSKGGKRLVFLFVVLGVLYFAGLIIASATLGTTTNSGRRSDVSDARATLDDAINQFQSQIPTCRADIICIRSADQDLSTAFSHFESDLTNIDFDSTQQSAADACESAAHQMATFLNEQSTASTAPTPSDTARFEQLGNNFDQAYNNLIDTL